MNYDLVIFDMDGTILDTLEDLKNSTNYALKQSGYPEHPLENIRQFVGNGIQKLIERAVPEGTSEADRQKVYEAFRAHYKVHCADNTKPYDGIPDLIIKLREAGIKTAVVSNKADPAVQDLVIEYFPNMFDVSVGEKPGVAKKPAPDAVDFVLETLSIPRERAVYIGDSDVDIATAENSHMDSIIVTWGFRDLEFLKAHGAKTIVDTTEEILELLL